VMTFLSLLGIGLSRYCWRETLSTKCLYKAHFEDLQSKEKQ